MYVMDVILPGAEFPLDGGDVRIVSTRGIQGSGYSSQLASDWLYRLTGGFESLIATSNGTEMPVIRGINFYNFKHGIGALGGGRVSIRSGGDVEGIAVSIPSNRKFVGDAIVTTDFPVSVTFQTQETELRGGGDLRLEVDGDITDTQLHVEQGRLDVFASGDIGTAADNQSGLYLLTGGTQSQISANGDFYVQGVNNIGMLPYSSSQVSDMTNVGSAFSDFGHYYSIYEPEDAMRFNSLGGDIVFRNDTSLWNSTVHYDDAGNDDWRSAVFPGSLAVHAVSGDILFVSDGSVINTYLWGAPQGQLELLAQNNILGDSNAGMVFSMLDFLPEELPNEDDVLAFTDVSTFNLSQLSEEHSTNRVHADDDEPVRIIANQGDISMLLPEDTSLYFYLPKKAEIIAGRDISEVSVYGQNINEDDVTLIQAGRDISFINTQTLGLATKRNRFSIGGSGEVYVLAGRNIDLGDQNGIKLTGNTLNTALPVDGARAYLMAGLGDQQPDYEGFLSDYFSYGSGYELDRLMYFETNRRGDMSEEQAAAFENDFLSLSADQRQTRLQDALQEMQSLPESQQRSFVLGGFFEELRASSSRAAQEQNRTLDADDNDRFGYTRGLDAMDQLFPGTVLASRVAGEISPGERITLTDGSEYRVEQDDLVETGGFTYVIPDVNPTYQGDIKLISSTIESSVDGGDISLLVPGGELNVGLSVVDTSGNKNVKGIVSMGDGDINVLALNDVAVNQSRIQALDGGDISIWSSKGDIDAGRGAKSSLSLPPPRIVIDNNGNIVQMFDAAVQGSGIRSASFTKDRDAGDVYLAAVSGVIDAGDAGIAAGGNLTLATDTVLNADNIEAGGDSLGVPAESAGVAVDLGNMDVSNSSGDGAAQSELVAKDVSDQLGEGALAILQVEIMGLLEETEATGEAGNESR
jgi:hypothetical protein